MAIERAQILLPARGRFDLPTLVRAQGTRLPPSFRWRDGRRPVLERAEQLADGSVYWLRIRPAATGVVLQVTGRDAREIEVLAPLAARVRRALFLDVDLAGFRRTCARDPLLRSATGLLRGTSVFEDVVAVLASAARGRDGAGSPIAGLAALGRRCPAQRTLRAFPDPAALARVSLRTLRALGLGRHADPVRMLARDVVRGRRDLDALGQLPLAAATRALRGIRGLGAVGRSRLLLTLGHFDVPDVPDLRRRRPPRRSARADRSRGRETPRARPRAR